ncbi:MAG: hypothetical protein K2I95_10220 [Treponemataceae bacterium]|nr:hypothetical protein [Treponemataceae bacterium]
MKKQFIVLASVSMLFAIIIASCSQVQGNPGDAPNERSIAGNIVEPPDFPAEYRELLDECEDLYQKMQEDPSYEAQFTEKKAELQKIKEKYGIESMTDEEMQEDILKHSGSNSKMKHKSSK